MPALTTCPKCGFHGSHGFNVNIPYTTSYYHDSCHWYRGIGGKTFFTYSAAVNAVHKADNRFDDLWLAYVLSKNPSREKLPRLHSKRCTREGLSKEDMLYLKRKGVKVSL